MAGPLLVGIDVGGTFTDIIVQDASSGALSAHKALSDRREPERGVLAAIAASGIDPRRIGLVVHGTTVATNALLERRGSRVAMVTTEGFRDVIELGRTTRLVPGTLYDPYFRKAPPLVPRRDRHVLAERVDATGASVLPPAEEDVTRLVALLRGSGADAVAVCFLNSFRNDAHELRVAEALRASLPHVTTSAEVQPEIREYERFSTTVANAYVMPVMAGYVERLVGALRAAGCTAPFYTMASNGGLMSTATVTCHPVRTMLSGPAAGLAAAATFGVAVGCADLITFDVGGTSSDVALISGGEWILRREVVLQGMVIRTPQIDIHTIGAGGGSIASLDAGGALHVGPESAGATPGPACYGRGGTAPTVTDANVVLGRLGAGQRLGGTLDVDAGLAREAVGRLAARQGIAADAMAAGIVALAVARMAAAIYEVSVARGRDPRDYALVPFGGAGPLHACEVAAELGIPRVLVPPAPGAFSAFGALCSPLAKDRARTLLTRLDEALMARVATLRADFVAAMAEEFSAEGIDPARLEAVTQVDARYLGQAHELTVSLPADADAAGVRAAFETAFQREYGRLDTGRAIEIVNLRVIGRIPVTAPAVVAPATPAVPTTTRRVHAGHAWHDAPVHQRGALARDATLGGPAIIEEMSATLFLPPGWTLSVGSRGELDLRHAEQTAGALLAAE
jgi:N-methylhydantoinase A